MSYVSRVLPPEEWPRLAGTEAETVWPHLSPENARIVVVEQDGDIVGTWTALRIVHAECVWVAPSHRTSPGVVRRLREGMYQQAREWGVKVLVTAALTDEVRTLAQKLGGVAIPGEVFAFPVPQLGGK